MQNISWCSFTKFVIKKIPSKEVINTSLKSKTQSEKSGTTFFFENYTVFKDNYATYFLQSYDINTYLRA